MYKEIQEKEGRREQRDGHWMPRQQGMTDAWAVLRCQKTVKIESRIWRGK